MPPRTSNKVKVHVRVRPTNNFATDMIGIGRDDRTISIHRTPSATVIDNKVNDWIFHFDGVHYNVNQEEIFEGIGKDVVDRTLDGYNGTIMCYGQTGAGKTHTMTGFTESYQNRGVIPRTLQYLYQEINARQDYSFSIRIAYLEIYNDQMCDLLRTLNSQSEYQQQQQQLSIGEDSGLVYIKGLSYRMANTEEEALNLLFEGETNRAIGQHVLNKQSSRSHCIFTILVECRSMLSSDEKYTISKLNLVDLAGSERLAKTNSEGVTKREATFINKSLSFLEQAVLNLSDKKSNSHNCRSSKLTHALKDSIGGRCNTVMIANIWPELQHLEETVSTLRFASRMMCVPAEPTVNEMIDPVKAVENYKRENKLLREELAIYKSTNNRNGNSAESLSEQQLYEIENQCRKFIDGTVDDIEVKNLRQVQATFNTLRNMCRATEKDVDRRNPRDRQDYDYQNAQKTQSGPINDFNSNHTSKDQRTNKETLAKTSKQQANVPTSNMKTSGAQQSAITKGKSPSTGSLQRNLTNDEEQYSRVKEPSDILDSKDNQFNTPTERKAAFEEFKQTRGATFNKSFLENKEIMATKKKQFAELARRINQAKAEIDKTRIDAERKKSERLTMGEFLNENGETIIDEEEYELIAKLQELKSTYRADYDQWKNLKSEITYSQNLVKQYQNRLLQEFDSWYNEFYLNRNPNNPGGMDDASTSNQNYRIYNDAAERFERMQKELLQSDLDNTPFRQAQMRRTVSNNGSAQGSTSNYSANSGPYGQHYDQEQQAYSSLPMNGNRQKPMVR